MKVLLTGASGFVGSHILEALLAGGIQTALLLRQTSSKKFLQSSLDRVEVRIGSTVDPESLRHALGDATHVIHCAGCTKALREADFFSVNQLGTRALIDAVNQPASRVTRFIQISSLAAVGPATPDAPALESQHPNPLTAYGKSKLAAEAEVRERCRPEFVILRPPAVYGPRDAEFLRLFKAVRWHLRPGFGAQAFSLVFVKDLAQAVVECLAHPGVTGGTFNVASSEVVTGAGLSAEIGRQMSAWALPVQLPWAVLWGACAGQELLSTITRRPSVLSLQKYRELHAPGWVCDPTRLRKEAGIVCATPLAAGIRETLTWYREVGWL